jgi:hypothetical protein
MIKNQYILHGFDLPIHELSPGFLLPVFVDWEGHFMIHKFNFSLAVESALPANPSDLYLALSTLRAVQKPVVKFLSTERVCLLDSAHYAFYDGQDILWGSRNEIMNFFKNNFTAFTDKLQNYPFVMAQVYDFLGDKSSAVKLRQIRGEQEKLRQKADLDRSDIVKIKSDSSEKILKTEERVPRDTIEQDRNRFTSLLFPNIDNSSTVSNFHLN